MVMSAWADEPWADCATPGCGTKHDTSSVPEPFWNNVNGYWVCPKHAVIVFTSNPSATAKGLEEQKNLLWHMACNRPDDPATLPETWRAAYQKG